MGSVLERANLNKIFLIYGNLDDMFISKDLQKNNFRTYLNTYLKNLGYKRIVYYSGAKNVGKYVLDDESAMLAINKNKHKNSSSSDNSRSGDASQKSKRRHRILNPQASAEYEKPSENNNAQPNNTDTKDNKITSPETDIRTQVKEKSSNNNKNKNTKKLIYRQPKITPAEFLDDAKKMMNDTEIKTAVIFTFIQDFLTDRSAPLQPYMELLSHLWSEYSINGNDNICIFLAPQMDTDDLERLFDTNENGEIFKNRFFNDSGSINRGCTINIGLPNSDEITLMLEYLRIVGDNGKKITFSRKNLHTVVSNIMFLSHEADKDETRDGYLSSIYDTITRYIHAQNENVVNIDENIIKKLYYKYKSEEETDPLTKLSTTHGWESVANRIKEILRDYKMKKTAAEKELETVIDKGNSSITTERLNKNDADSGFKYPVPHFILRGNPGVGKTTVARLIGQIFYDAGILKKGHTVEAKRDDLVDRYVGGTAVKTTECVMQAQDGVLFIDDAYSLIDKGEDNNYPKEAIDTLVPIMTNPEKYRFCMIMAGYPEPMDELLEMNSGLRSRFSKANIITIEDYKPDVLKEIFVNSCKKDGYRFWGDADGEENPLDLDLFFNNLYQQRNRADFGNARDIVALAKEAKMQSSLRDDILRCIVKEDFGDSKKYFEKHGADSIDDIYAEIDKYVGMDFVKDLFKNIRLEVLDAKDCKERGIKPEVYADHFIFAGNPGTGKTTVGKMIGSFYHLMEVLGGSETIFVDASDLIGTHYGDSKNKVNEAIQNAIDHNAVLYIDEAYQICDSGYASEIVGAMMTKMTENAADFKMIFGMYTNRVEDFMKLNAGLARRVRVVNFPDYNPSQLLEIFDRTIKAQGCTITEEAHKRVSLIMEYKYNTRTESFGNAGEVKKLAIDMKRLRLERVYSSENSDVNRYEYTVDDIPQDMIKLIQDQLNPRSFDDIMKDLNNQIGMSDLKNIIVAKQEEVLYARKSGQSLYNINPGYYFFVGNPGTGKSTSAKLFAESLYKLGVVKSPDFHSCTAKDLIGEHVGETAQKSYNLLKKSINGVLFIDEAYSLSYSDSNGGGDSFKKEALEQIIAFMDDPEHRRRCCIIFAGYLKDMQGLYKSNSGMRSRIEEVYFKDYTAEEAYQIFEVFCRKGGYLVADGVKDIYIPIFEKLTKLEYYSNGRTARTVYEKTLQKLKRRVIHNDYDDISMTKTILKDDLLTEDECTALVSTG